MASNGGCFHSVPELPACLSFNKSTMTDYSLCSLYTDRTGDTTPKVFYCKGDCCGNLLATAVAYGVSM
jgi:hypothetical protein